MHSLRAVLSALYKASRRDRTSLWSFSTNNLFMTSLFIGAVGSFFLAVMALVLIFPLTSDPLRKFPADRLGLLPLASRERIALRLVSLWMNPVTWIVAVLAIWAAFDREPAFASAVLVIPIAGLLLSWVPSGPRRSIWRRLPAFPGPLGQLIRKDVREILCTLDFWFALVFSGSCLLYRVFVHELPKDALMMFSIIVVLAISTWSQSAFGLDGDDGVMRYRLLPLQGWQILAAKGAAFMLVVTFLALPLSLPTAWAAGLVAFALGNKDSVLKMKVQRRWRFTNGTGGITSLMQIFLSAAAGAATYRVSAWILVPSFLLFVFTSFRFGRHHLFA